MEPFRDTKFDVAVSWYTNPQTEAFARLLQIPNKVNPVPAGTAPPMVQGTTEAENPGERAVNVDADTDVAALASRPQDGEVLLPKVGENVNEGAKMEEGDVEDVPSDGDAASAMTYPVQPISSGRWSPSRIMSE